MTTGQDARLYDLGYRSYDGPRERPARAILTLAEFTARRVLGLGRGARHKVLPAITLAIAFLPALSSVLFAVLATTSPRDDLITYGDYMFIIGSALALFAALVAPEALCPDRRTGMLGLYLAGPLDRNRYLVAKGAGVLARHAPDHGRPAALHAARLRPRRLRAVRRARLPSSWLRILAAGIMTALLYASLCRWRSRASRPGEPRRRSASCSSSFVPASVVRPAIESADAPNELDLLSSPFVAVRARVPDLRRDARRRRAGHGALDLARRRRASAAPILAGALVCWLRYRRLEAFR